MVMIIIFVGTYIYIFNNQPENNMLPVVRSSDKCFGCVYAKEAESVIFKGFLENYFRPLM